MAEKEKKVTIMVLDVDLQCSKCYKKVKKVLCKFPQIRDQVYDEKANKVIIKVVCCSPEKIRDKLCCKGGGCIKRIEIKEPEKPKPPPEKPKPPPEKPKPPPPPPPPAEPPKPPPPPPPAEPAPPPPPPPPAEPVKPKPPPPAEPAKPPPPCKPHVPVCYPPPPCLPPPGFCCTECYHGVPGGPCFRGWPIKPAEKPKPQPPPPCEPHVPVCYPPPPCLPPPGFCCTECSHGVPGGPCLRGGPIQYDGYCGRPVYDSWGGGGGYSSYYGSRCDYFSEENPQGCSIM